MNSENTPIFTLKNNIKKRICSEEKKRNRNMIWQNRYKFVRVISGVISILLVSFSGYKEFAEYNLYLIIAAVITTSITTLSSDLLSTFGYEDRFQKNVSTVGELKNLYERLKLDIAIEGPEGIDYWEYQKELDLILSSQNKKWEKMFTKSKSA